MKFPSQKNQGEGGGKSKVKMAAGKTR